jgi:hypothetical protein
VQLELTDDETVLLRELLDGICRDLSYEIADTDSSTFRAGLRNRRDATRKMLDAVGGPLPDLSGRAPAGTSPRRGRAARGRQHGAAGVRSW